MNYVKEYYSQMESGSVVVCEEIRAIYKRLCEEMDITKEDPFPFYFSEEVGAHAIDFIETYCKYYQGDKAGQLVTLELFQKAFIQSLFGWLEKETNRRRFREYFSRLQGSTARVLYPDVLQFICLLLMEKTAQRFTVLLRN